VDIASVAHKGFLKFIEQDDPAGLKVDQVRRIRAVLAALLIAPDMKSLDGPPGWRIHRLKGDRKGDWSISVSGNWRLTFRIQAGVIADLDREDYH